MKIALPADETGSDTSVSVSFGRSPFMIFFDSDTGKYTAEKNPGADADGSAGVKAAQAVVDFGANAVITFRCGENAAAVLSAAGIRLYTAVSGSISDTVALFQQGKLAELHDIHSGLHHHGGAQ